VVSTGEGRSGVPKVAQHDHGVASETSHDCAVIFGKGQAAGPPACRPPSPTPSLRTTWSGSPDYAGYGLPVPEDTLAECVWSVALSQEARSIGRPVRIPRGGVPAPAVVVIG
jgi:hypothetical protein